MSERDSRARGRRIVVAFDTTPLGEVALEAAAGLATALHAELSGLFIEDVNLMRIARLPFARELGLASAVTRPLGASDIERALRWQAERNRAWLESVAVALDLRWSFQVVRGQALAAILECWREPDLVVFGRTERATFVRGMSMPARTETAAGAGPSQLERFRRLSLRSIALLFDSSERAQRALEVAFALAATAGTRLTLLVLAADREEFERLRDAARAWLAQRDATVRFRWLRSREPAAVAEALRAEDTAALLWHDENTAQDRQRFHALHAVVSCPIVLLS